MESTRDFAIALRDAGAIDILDLSMVIPLPGTGHVGVPDHRAEDDGAARLRAAGRSRSSMRSAPSSSRVLARVSRSRGDRGTQRRPSSVSGAEVYQLSDRAQIVIMQSYDAFNADLAQTIELNRPKPEWLWAYRERVRRRVLQRPGDEAADAHARRATQPAASTTLPRA